MKFAHNLAEEKKFSKLPKFNLEGYFHDSRLLMKANYISETLPKFADALIQEYSHKKIPHRKYSEHTFPLSRALIPNRFD